MGPLHGLASEHGDIEGAEVRHRLPRHKKSRHSHSTNTSRSVRDPEEASTKENLGVPDIEDILNNFKPPEGRRIFKTEPVEEEWSSLAPQNQARGRRQRDQHNPTVTPHRSTNTLTDDEYSNGGCQFSHPGTLTDRNATDIVDLTTEDTKSTQSVIQDPLCSTRVAIPRPLTVGQVEVMNDVDIPDNILQQVRDIYWKNGFCLSSIVKKWRDLIDFAGQHHRSDFITTELCAQAQAHAFWSATGLQAEQISRVARQKGIDIGNGDNATSNLNRTSQSQLDPPQQVRIQTLIDKIEFDLPAMPDHQMMTNGDQKRGRSRLKTSASLLANLIQSPSLASGSSRFAAPGTLRQQEMSQAQLEVLLKPLDVMPELLPASAPEGCPRLVRLWSAELLKLPKDRHDHLDLQDTVASILARYDLKNASVIQAFLDKDQVPHFFFLFKARDTMLHSWSVERKDDIVTIGIERQRAPNLDTSEALRPSAGQYDLTIRYRLDPIGPCSVDEPTTEATRASYLARWVPVGTSIFPASPNIATFLYSTPPSRGADEHELYHHPLQTHTLPKSHISILARYFQNTAFQTTAMDGEFQIAYGRKVRYDAVLGRVRALWDYALKGAKTQKAKRQRGEYNRPSAKARTNQNSETDLASQGRTMRKRAPGSGVARDYLPRSWNVSVEEQQKFDPVHGEDAVGETDQKDNPGGGEGEQMSSKRIKRERYKDEDDSVSGDSNGGGS